jgi:hypothetical protein
MNSTTLSSTCRAEACTAGLQGTPRAASEILNRHHEGACGLSGSGRKRNRIELANAGALDQQRDALRQTRRNGHVIPVVKSALE